MENVAVNDAATAGEWEADLAIACNGTGLQRQRTSQGNGREPRRARGWARATAEKHGSVPVETKRRKKSLHPENPREPETGDPAKRTCAHPLESGAMPRDAAATDWKEKAMKEKGPIVLEVTEVRNMDVPELKTIVCCDNPATGECLNVCCLEYGGKRVLSLATDAVPRPMRPSGSCSLWLDVDSGEWGGSAPTCGEDQPRRRDTALDATEAARIANACGLDAVAQAVLAALRRGGALDAPREGA